MPVKCALNFKGFSAEDFRRLDYQVMAQIYACHNEFGRLCDEAIYKNDIKARLEEHGLGPVRLEVPLIASWREFSKTYYLDLVVQNTAVYELKANKTLVGENQAQLLNYLLLLNLSVGKLVNLGSASVQKHFVNSRLTLEKRRCFNSDVSGWRELSPVCASFREALLEMLSDWGAFLDLSLYQEALTWFLGGEEKVVQRLELFRNGPCLGTQRCHLLAPDVAFRLTAFTRRHENAEADLRQFLTHTRLRAIQWINFNHAQIEFITLLK